jgi:hypothetical protein
MYLFTMNVLRFNIEIALEVHIHQRSVFFLEKKIEEKEEERNNNKPTYIFIIIKKSRKQ